jgi:hypothetical protein
MNEKIKELAQQAGIIGQSENSVSPLIEKFAESIIRECAGIAERPHEYIKTQSGQQIRKHFGVEE